MIKQLSIRQWFVFSWLLCLLLPRLLGLIRLTVALVLPAALAALVGLLGLIGLAIALVLLAALVGLVCHLAFPPSILLQLRGRQHIILLRKADRLWT